MQLWIPKRWPGDIGVEGFMPIFFVRLDGLDVRTLRVLNIVLKLGMGAQKPLPKLGYGGPSCKVHY